MQQIEEQHAELIQGAAICVRQPSAAPEAAAGGGRRRAGSQRHAAQAGAHLGHAKAQRHPQPKVPQGSKHHVDQACRISGRGWQDVRRERLLGAAAVRARLGTAERQPATVTRVPAAAAAAAAPAAAVGNLPMTTKLQPRNIQSRGCSWCARSLPSSVLPSASITTVLSRLWTMQGSGKRRDRGRTV